jgi:probable HAF family extracellular repeat protein
MKRLTLLGCLLFAATTCFAQMYTVMDLGTLCTGDNAWSTAAGINDAGQVIGSSYTPGRGQLCGRSYRTAPNSPINPGTDDLGPYTSAAAINSAGQVVGTFFLNLPYEYTEHGFRTAPNRPVNPYTDDVGTLQLGTGGYDDSFARGINASGQVVGTSFGFFTDHAFRTGPNRPINPETDDIGRFPGDFAYSEAYGINSAGQVVGVFSANDTIPGHAFRTASNRPINPATDDLGTLHFTNQDGSTAYAINDFGQVVGMSYNAGEFYIGHAFRTAPNQPINPDTDDLGTLPGGNVSTAAAVDNFGQVVGYGTFADKDELIAYHAILYSGGAMRDLNDLIPDSGWVLSSAVGINNNGQIAANGERNGSTRALLLSPIYTASVQRPINADGSSVFSATRGVVPVKFAVTKYANEASCTLPATIALTRATRQTLTSIHESTYASPENNGSSFRIAGCQYVYNLAASSLGVGTYRADISINGIIVGHAVFALK